MTDTLEQAANAFDAALGNADTSLSRGGGEGTVAAETLFGNLGEQETDRVAGGDVDEDKPKRRQPKEPEGDVGEGEFDFENPFGKPEEGAEDDEEGAEDAEDGDEPEEGAEDDEEGAEDDETLMTREFTVMVDGQEVNVPLREALNGYIRTKTFHQRMNQLDQVRGQVADYAQNLMSDRQRVDEMMADAEELIRGVIPAEPDWDKLFAEDPAAARALQVQFNMFSNKINEIRGKRAQIAKEAAERTAREKADYLRQELPKFYQAAGFRSNEEAARGINSMRRTALNCGFSEEEVAGVFDSRMLNVLLKAAKYDAIMSNKPKAVKNGKTPVKPGTVSPRGPVRKGIKGANKNHARSGTVESAADVFAKMLK